MKATCKLFAREFARLRLPAVISVIALTLFTGALLAVVTVYTNLYESVFSVVDGDGFNGRYSAGVSLISGLLVSSGVALFLTNGVIIYSLYSIMLDNRRHFIGRLLLLGYGEKHIFGIYFSILTVITLAVNVGGALFSGLIGTGIISACSRIFGIQADSVLPWWAPAGNFIITTLISLPLYRVSVRRIRKISLQEVAECGK